MDDPLEFDAETATLYKQALQLHQLGILDRAGRLYVKVLEKHPQARQVMDLYNRLRRQTAGPRPASSPWRVVWQHPPEKSWEADWLRYLLADVSQEEPVVDTTHGVCFDNMIVVDHRITAATEPYYANASFQGCNVVLFHLSDEWYADDYSCYRWCDRVFRNHWTFMHADDRKVMFFPLGYKTGFSRQGTSKTTAERRYRWSFVGDANKSSRPAMLEALRPYDDHFVHLTSGFNAADALPTDRYREIMEESVLVPCPAGWQNLESFRTWEALEAGCIPIVERRAQFDYYAALCGPTRDEDTASGDGWSPGGSYPFPSVIDWAEAADVLRQDADELEALRQRCSAWWQAHKASLRARIAASLHTLTV